MMDMKSSPALMTATAIGLSRLLAQSLCLLRTLANKSGSCLVAGGQHARAEAAPPSATSSGGTTKAREPPPHSPQSVSVWHLLRKLCGYPKMAYVSIPG